MDRIRHEGILRNRIEPFLPLHATGSEANCSVSASKGHEVHVFGRQASADMATLARFSKFVSRAKEVRVRLPLWPLPSHALYSFIEV